MNFKQYAMFMWITRAKQKGEQLPVSLPQQLIDMVDKFVAKVAPKPQKQRTMQGEIPIYP